MSFRSRVITLPLAIDLSFGEIEWNLDVYVGWDRNHENAVFTAFGTAPSAAGSQLAAADGWATTNYRRHARLVLKWRLKSPTSTPKAGVLSAVMHVTTKGT